MGTKSLARHAALVFALMALSSCILPIGDRFDYAIVFRKSDGAQRRCWVFGASAPGFFIWDDWTHTKAVQECIDDCKAVGFEEVDFKDPMLKRSANGELMEDAGDDSCAPLSGPAPKMTFPSARTSVPTR